MEEQQTITREEVKEMIVGNLERAIELIKLL